MNPNPVESPAANDALAVEAIRAGDRDRYEELVERHADKVFAIAWCRLGDRDLAEEAAQEAFISAYRRLGLLGHAEKFGAWIAAIARNSAINLGLRRRGELRKRQRWALEQTPADPLSIDETVPNRETLRATLEDLPPIHRECLVLFYLESRSIADASRALGISENAFKVRLHRARGVLRDALETRLESGLDQLRAPTRLARAVMLALPAPPTGLLALGGIASGVAKLVPFSAILVFFQIASTIPGLMFARWIGNKELANFRDPGGFRGRLYGRFLSRTLIAIGVLVALMMLSMAGLGLRLYSTLFGAAFLVSGFELIRRLHVIRHPLQIACTFAIVGVAIPLFGLGVLQWPVGVLLVGQGLFFLAMSFGIPTVAPRMDYSLFTRATHGLLPLPAPDRPVLVPAISSPASTLAFARFLGRHLLIEDWRRTAQGLELRLARVLTNILTTAVPFYWGRTSRLVLHHDGRIDVRLGDVDRQELSLNTRGTLPGASALEHQVTVAVRNSRDAFLAGDVAQAAACLGEQDSKSIFRQTPASSPATRWRVWILRIAAVLMPALGIFQLGFQKTGLFQQATSFKPVSISESDVRAFLSDLAPTHTNHATALMAWQSRIGYLGIGLPQPGLFPPATLAFVKSNTVGYLANHTPLTTPPELQLGYALGNSAFLNAAIAGYFSADDLKACRLDPDSVRDALPRLDPDLRRNLLSLEEMPVKDRDCSVLDSVGLATRVRFLALSGCPDLPDAPSWVPILRRCQILSTNGAPNRCSLASPDAVHGLFQTGFGEYLRDTRDVLYLLDAAHALGQIDRDACIDGILRMHRGKGLFIPDDPKAGLIRADADTTWFALESLRILGALDRVPDLPKWEFRAPKSTHTTFGGTAQILDPTALGAWCLKQAFQQELPELFRGSNPPDRETVAK